MIAFVGHSDGLKYQLERQGFRGDDMLQEGLAEVVTSKTFKLRVVQTTKDNATNEVVIENNTVYIQVTSLSLFSNFSKFLTENSFRPLRLVGGTM